MEGQRDSGPTYTLGKAPSGCAVLHSAVKHGNDAATKHAAVFRIGADGASDTHATSDAHAAADPADAAAADPTDAAAANPADPADATDDGATNSGTTIGVRDRPKWRARWPDLGDKCPRACGALSNTNGHATWPKFSNSSLTSAHTFM